MINFHVFGQSSTGTTLHLQLLNGQHNHQCQVFMTLVGGHYGAWTAHSHQGMSPFVTEMESSMTVCSFCQVEGAALLPV